MSVSLTGDTAIILASDGILEAKNQAGEMFGFERFQQSVQQIPAAASSQEILDHIWRDAGSYIQGAEPHDDMTLVVVQAANHS